MASSNYTLGEDAPRLFSAISKGPKEVYKFFGGSPTFDDPKDVFNNSALLVAAGQGNVETIKYLLDLGANIHDKNIFGKSALHFASAKGHEAAVKLLLERGANVHAIDNSGNKVLHSAAEGGSIKIASLFLDLGVVIGSGSFEVTYLQYAARGGHLQMIDFLIKHGADVNETSYSDMTPILHASETGSVNAVRLLLERGANIGAQDNFNSNVLYFAVESGNEKLIQLLLNLKIGVNYRGFKGRTALHVAERSGNIKLMELLLDHGAFINVKDSDDRSVLYRAVESGHESIVQLLLDHGALITDDICTLYFAIKSNNVNFLKQILDSGVDVNKLDKKGRSALHYACKLGNESIVRLLLAQGALITEDNFKKTVLHFGAKGGNENIIQLFLDRGLAVDVRDKKRKTPLHVAIKNKRPSAFKFLMDSGANINARRGSDDESALYIAIYHDFEYAVKLLLERAATIDLPAPKGIAISRSNNAQIVKLLLHNGARYNVDSVLSYILSNNLFLIAEKLFDEGLQLNLKNNYFILHPDFPFFKRNKNTKVDESLQIFLDHGLNVDKKGDSTLVYFALSQSISYSAARSAAKIITRHVVKMKHQNLHVSEAVWSDMKNYDEDKTVEPYKAECEKEIEKMKKEEFYNSTVSYFDVLSTRNQQQLVSFARNKDIIQGVKSSDKMFPIYSSSLCTQIRNGTWRKVLIEQAGDFFIAVTSAKCTDHQLPKLPATFIHELSSYLSNKELKMLTRACKSKFDMDIHDVTENVIYN